jgi:hypothetical protein
VWPLPQNQILRCGPPPRGIESYGVAPSTGSTLWGLERDRDMGMDRGWDRDRDRISTVAPPGGSVFPLWPLSQDRTFCCGPSRGIGLSDVAPPSGSDFPMWPLPQDRVNSNILIMKMLPLTILTNVNILQYKDGYTWFIEFKSDTDWAVFETQRLWYRNKSQKKIVLSRGSYLDFFKHSSIHIEPYFCICLGIPH